MIPVPEGTSRSRAVSLARRLLSGSGRASALAFREDPQTSFSALAHGLLPDGALVIAVAHDSPADVETSGIDVRLDVEKFAPDAELVIRAATVHGLGRLRTLDAGEALQRRAQGDLPDLLALTVGIPGVRLVEVEVSRVLVHDCDGVTSLDWAEVTELAALPPFPGLLDELGAADIVGEVSGAQWLGVIESILTGRLPGAELGRLGLAGACPHSVGSVRVVDVDTVGVTVMHFTHEAATTFFVPFSAPVATLDALRGAVQGLLPPDGTPQPGVVDQAGATS